MPNGSVDRRSLRIAVVNSDRCKPEKCSFECKRYCPVVSQGKHCVEVSRRSRQSIISEPLCSGCGICVEKCPFHAIKIINLPHCLSRDTVHRHGANGFKLHRLPLPRRGQVLGLLGANGMGKSTALALLAGMKPNLGNVDQHPEWKDILAHFRGSELHGYFKRYLDEQYDPRIAVKAQYVERWIEASGLNNGVLVKDAFTKHGCPDAYQAIAAELDLTHLQNREVAQLSGGEKQRFAIAYTCVQDADIYMFDEPSAFLDIHQRLRASESIRKLLKSDNFVIAVEHDLAVLEYLSDYVCLLYGKAAGYGVVTKPIGVREGINIFLDGYIPGENMRFREEALTFSAPVCEAESNDLSNSTFYPKLTKTMGAADKSNGFKLEVQSGFFSSGEIIAMLGRNGSGKTTFIKMLAGQIEADAQEDVPLLQVSVKPQDIRMKTKAAETVRGVLQRKINTAFQDPMFQSVVVKPLCIDQLADLQLSQLSGGELQRVSLVLALGQPADVFLIDEPSAYLDAEQRVAASKVLRRFVTTFDKSAFILEHDFLMATYLADKVVVFDGEPGMHCFASSPMPLVDGMNLFLAQLQVTFRRPLHGSNPRSRINKCDGARDREQKRSGEYFFMEY